MDGISFLKTLLPIPFAVLALLVTFRYKTYDETLTYCTDIEDFVTASVEQTTDVSPEDVHRWAWSLRAVWLYRKCCRATIYLGFGSIVSWFLAVGLSKVDPFQLGSWRVPFLGLKTAVMAQNFAIALLVGMFLLVAWLFYMDHKRKDRD
ncbi:hypothetical protein [Halorussus ruber]|uniref:hypothetical protein n=1 Tax=Halorussus ruber TaxID=1126238 RepID=UPI001091F77A|nr:hypothetical protein [Halorussus ruber]